MRDVTDATSVVGETFQLLTDKPRPAQQSQAVEQVAEVLESGLLARLRTLSETAGVSLGEVLLAAFAVLLSRYTGEQEVAIILSGSGSVANEVQSRVANIHIGDDDLFVKVLRAAVEAQAGATQARNATSSVAFWALAGSDAEGPQSNKPSVDLALLVESVERDGKVSLCYAPELFEPSTPKRLLRGLQILLAGIAEFPDTPVRLLPILSDEDRAKILFDWNRTTSDVWQGQCLHQLFEGQARQSPESVAVEHEGVRLSYADLNAKANQLARYLTASGVAHRSFIGICLPPCADFAIATLAVLKAGCACMPLDPKYPPDRIAYMMEDAGAKFVLTLGGTLPSGLSSAITTIDLANLRDLIGCQSRENSDQVVSPFDVAYLIYTSGSTGKPRGVMLRHAGLANYNLVSARYYQMKPGDRVLQFCSLSFDAAVEEVFATLVSGATLVFRSKDMPLDVPGFLHWVRREKITVLDLPTAYWHEWVSQFNELRESVPNRLRLVIVGGERALASALTTWRQVRHGVRWVNTYGPTEASIAVTRYDPEEQHATSTPANVPIGRPIENCRVYVLDGERNPVPIGVPGELYLGGIGVAQGYLNRPDLTTQKFLADPFSTDPNSRLYRTGDIVRFLENGMLEYLGRQDDQVKVRGFRVELGEIEEVLARHESVSESAVVAVDDPVQGKKLIAYCSPSGTARLDASHLRAFVVEKLPSYMVPSSVVIVDVLPKTPNGKIDRRALSGMERSTLLPSAEVDLPVTPLQTQLKKIWEDTLGHKPIGLRENFFELGGHSLLAARLMQKISRMQGRTIPLGLLFEAPTIERLADVLERNEWTKQWSCLVPIQPQGSRPPLFCVHGVGGNVVGFRELARLMSPDYPFYGFQAQGLDGTRPPFAEIEAMAAHYIREIRGVQPEGPFYLGGYSFGGLVAYEMARQLRSGGEEVALLALLDTYPGELEAISTSIWKLLLQPKRLRLLSDVPKTAKKSVQRRVKGLFLSKTLKDVLQANHRASARYVLEPYEGETTLFRAEQSSLRAFDDPHAAWASLAIGGLNVVEIAGDHGDILVVPQVDELATKLKAAIDLASAESEVREDRKEEAIA